MVKRRLLSRIATSNERVPILSSLVLRSLRARRVPPHEGEARCSAVQPRLATRSVQQLPTLGSRVCEYLLLPLSRLSLFSSVATRLQHPSPFHSRVPASRPTTNPCARIMIRDCVSEGSEEAKSAFVCGSVSLSLSPPLSFSPSPSLLSRAETPSLSSPASLVLLLCRFLRNSMRAERDGRACCRSHSRRCRSFWPLWYVQVRTCTWCPTRVPVRTKVVLFAGGSGSLLLWFLFGEAGIRQIVSNCVPWDNSRLAQRRFRVKPNVAE
jgi:hypothetical protein